MKITVKKLSELHKPAHNIRRHSEKQLTEYIRSIEMFGQVKPLVVAEDGEIIAGNGLYEALLRMGRETCDCYVMVGLTDVQKKKLMMHHVGNLHERTYAHIGKAQLINFFVIGECPKVGFHNQ